MPSGISIFDAALEYAGYGWKIVPLHDVDEHGSCSCRQGAKCSTPGKHPRINEWQIHATDDEEKIAGWWEKTPMANVGFLLGKGSGVVDFESDSDEQQKTLVDLFGGEPPITSCYESSRGLHHLFEWRDDLPGGATFKVDDLVLRLGNNEQGAMSVLPPSMHPSGRRYKWKLPPRDCEPIKLSDEIVTKIWNWDNRTASGPSRKTKDDWLQITAGGKREGEGRNDDATVYIGGLLRKIEQLDDEDGMSLIYEAANAINQRNKDPLADDEFRRTFKSIWRKEQQRRIAESAELDMPQSVQDSVGSKDSSQIKTPRGMRLVIVRDDPPIYEIHAPQFSKARKGCIRVSAQQLCSFQAIRVAALEQADYPFTPGFQKAWNARGGVYQQLVESAEEREVSAATKIMVIAAEYLLGVIDSAIPQKDGQKGPDRRRPTKMQEDGSVWLKWAEVWKDAVLSGIVHRDDVRRLSHALELSREDCKIFPNRGPVRQRYTIFGDKLRKRLLELAEATDDKK